MRTRTVAVALVVSVTCLLAEGPDTAVVTDIDGNVYRTVRIGNQVWMAENLRTTRLNDGQPIPHVTDTVAWSDLRSPGYCFYGNDAANKDAYGALYNWYAVGTGRLAPQGWHVPTDAEWQALADFLGGNGVAGGKLKEPGTAHWAGPNRGATNEAGFGGRGGGVRNRDGSFGFLREMTKYWTASEGGDNGDALYRTLATLEAFLGKSSHGKMDGKSVRGVKDDR